MKLCKKCNTSKEINLFYKVSNSKDGISWGDWHVDHKKPVSKFDINTSISIINSLDNLQPLWAFENLSKNNKY